MVITWLKPRNVFRNVSKLVGKQTRSKVFYVCNHFKLFTNFTSHLHCSSSTQRRQQDNLYVFILTTSGLYGLCCVYKYYYKYICCGNFSKFYTNNNWLFYVL